MIDTLESPARSRPTEPEVGMGVTMAMRSDRLAGTIQEIFAIQGDPAFTCSLDQCLPDGTYRTRPEGERYSFRRRGTGDSARWEQVSRNARTERWVKSSAGMRLTLGMRDAHRDPQF